MSTRISHDPQRWFLEQQDRIKANPDLSPEGRQRQINEAHQEAKKEFERNRQAKRVEWDSKRDKLLKPILTPPGGHTLESRSLLAQAREQIKKPEQAMDALKDAQLSGDKLAAWAAGVVATERGMHRTFGEQWMPAIKAWAQNDLTKDHELGDLFAHIDTQPSRRQQLREQMFASGDAQRGAYVPPREDGDPNADLTLEGIRRQEKREEIERVHEQQRSPQPYIGPSPHRDPVDDGAPIVPGVWG